MSYRIETKHPNLANYEETLADYFRDHYPTCSMTPRSVETLIDSAAQILHQAYEWNNENEDAMKPWYDALDALDAESVFPVTLGPTPDGVILILHHVEDDPMVELILVEDESE